MNKVLKSTFSFAAAAVLAGLSAAPALAWGDNAGGRASYTLDQINSGVLGNKIVLNSISDSTIGDEKNFVGAREYTGKNEGKNNVWNGNEITVEDGKSYLVRLYVHNNNPNGTDAIAKDVSVAYVLPTTSGKSVEVNGIINSSNATPSKYWDNVIFKGNSNFHLEYVKGSALLENNGIGKNGGIALSDSIVDGGVRIGYDKLDGNIPGCYQYASYITIKVNAVFDDMIVEKQVSKTGESGTWTESINANVGDTVYYRIHYKNTSGVSVTNVSIKDVLPTNMEYVKGSTVLYNATNPKGIARDDTINTKGVNVGGYADKGDAYVVFAAKVVDVELACGSNKLVNWAQVSVNNKVSQDSADVLVNKVCKETPVNPTPVEPTPGVLPKTGASFVVTALGLGSVVTAAGYYIASRKALR